MNQTIDAQVDCYLNQIPCPGCSRPLRYAPDTEGMVECVRCHTVWELHEVVSDE